MLEGKTILEHKFHKMDGHRITVEWLDEDDQAMTEPIIIEEPEGLDMRMPDNTLTVEDIAKTLGESTPLEVIGTLHSTSWCTLLNKKFSIRRSFPVWYASYGLCLPFY